MTLFFWFCGLLPAEMSEGLYGIWAGTPPKDRILDFEKVPADKTLEGVHRRFFS